MQQNAFLERQGTHWTLCDLTAAASVTFNGTLATFTVGSATQVKATVPAGASTGTLQVTVPGGRLSSNVPFTPKP
jgi:uncharacterized protein (TIGR03437 family)